ncbi:hypothetical protein [Herbaspirillum sp. SJZ107]|nr:hypothetical protein [Herbaspirillum sp. SJZ107]TQK11721.1 hypothetical protein FBX97_1670 [Herbaspirillum sp. SJZ107]
MPAVRLHQHGNRDAPSPDQVPVRRIAGAHAPRGSGRAAVNIVLFAGTP